MTAIDALPTIAGVAVLRKVTAAVAALVVLIATGGAAYYADNGESLLGINLVTYDAGWPYVY